MAAIQHTPEPWHQEAGDGSVIRNANRAFVAVAATKATARRIVACVSTLENVSIDTLEEGRVYIKVLENDGVIVSVAK